MCWMHVSAKCCPLFLYGHNFRTERRIELSFFVCFFVIRLEQGENLEENQRNLLQITERFFQAIISSSGEFPPQLRSVCHCLYQVDPCFFSLQHESTVAHSICLPLPVCT